MSVHNHTYTNSKSLGLYCTNNINTDATELIRIDFTRTNTVKMTQKLHILIKSFFTMELELVTSGHGKYLKLKTIRNASNSGQ